MARTATDSKSQTARKRARRAMADELERARKLEAQLASVFTAIDTMDEAKKALGGALQELRDLDVAQSDLAAKTGLSAREVSAALRSAKAVTNDSVPAEETTSDTDTDDAPVSVETEHGSETT